MVDLHTHSHYSGDIPKGKGSSVEELCLAALQKGVKTLAVTDHCDIDGIYYGYFPALNHKAVTAEIEAAKEKFFGKLELLYGIEVGQGAHMPREASQLLTYYPFDIVIGSVHATRGIIDICDLPLKDYTEPELLALWEKYLSELAETIEWGDFDILAHITYPYRYFVRAGRGEVLQLDKKGREYFENILKSAINHDLILEVNTSGLRQGLGCTMPDFELVRFYKQLGGKNISVGSDAHNARDIGADIKETLRKLSALGFENITASKQRKHYQISIDSLLNGGN